MQYICTHTSTQTYVHLCVCVCVYVCMCVCVFATRLMRLISTDVHSRTYLQHGHMIAYAQAFHADVTSSPRLDMAGNLAAHYSNEAPVTIHDGTGLRSRVSGGSGARTGYQGMSVTGAVGFADPEPPPRLGGVGSPRFQAV